MWTPVPMGTVNKDMAAGQQRSCLGCCTYPHLARAASAQVGRAIIAERYAVSSLCDKNMPKWSYDYFMRGSLLHQQDGVLMRRSLLQAL